MMKKITLAGTYKKRARRASFLFAANSPFKSRIVDDKKGYARKKKHKNLVDPTK